MNLLALPEGKRKYCPKTELRASPPDGTDQQPAAPQEAGLHAKATAEPANTEQLQADLLATLQAEAEEEPEDERE